MVELLAFIACTILACLGIFQLLLILGKPLGRFAWGGSYEVLPTKFRIGSAISIALYTVFVIIILSKAGIISVISENVASKGIWVITVYFFVGIFLNGISRSKSERAVMTPVVIALAISCLLIALS